MAHGYRTELWTTARIADLIKEKFAVRYHRDHIGRLMACLGWTYQKPEKRALERNEPAIEEWKRTQWPRIKKRQAAGRLPRLPDETGFLLIPPVRKTWAPRGQTPVVRHHQKRERISVIGGLSVSPKRQHIGLFYQLHGKNIQQPEVCSFLRHLLRHLHAPVIVLWDNGKPHKGEPIRQFCRHHPRLRLESFPPYAPEINPSENVWSQAKNSMANGRPDDRGQLWEHLLLTFSNMGSSQPTLRACIHLSDLPPFLR